MIQLRQLNKFFRNGDNALHVLKDLSLEIAQGEFVTIMGPSGSGKSTLINVIGFLDNDFEGEYLFEGRPVHQRTDDEISRLRNQMVGFVFQDFNLINEMTAADNVRLPLLYRGLRRGQTHEAVAEALESVGLSDKADSRPPLLSGGQRQRVAIARALVGRPHFIIADEPTGALDTKTSQLVMEILAQLNREWGVTIIMVTHDPTLQVYASRHIDIVDGRIRDRGSEMTPTFVDEKLLARAEADDAAHQPFILPERERKEDQP